HIADAPTQVPKIVNDVGAEDPRSAGVRKEQRDEDAEQGRLAGTIRPDHAEDLAGAHRKRQGVDGCDAVEPLRRRVNDDRVAGSAHREAVTVVNRTSAGMPILSVRPALGTRTLIA